MFKKTICFLSILLFWFFSSCFFPYDSGFYQSLNIPPFTPSILFINIAWITIYILNTASIYNLIKEYPPNNNYYFNLIINYIFNQIFPLFFFYFNNLFISLILSIIIVISSIFLYLETQKIDKISAILLIPYIIWSSISLILSISIYFIN